MKLFDRFADRIIDKIASRDPDVIIGGTDDPYLKRWWVIPRNRFFNIYLHRFCRSDDDRALHDHPWMNLSILLRGYYVEHTIADGGINRRQLRRKGAVKLRLPSSAHRIELPYDRPCWTLFITGPVVRGWGFHCPDGWVPWREFTDEAGTGVGRGCGE